jgi:hypothetical protein
VKKILLPLIIAIVLFSCKDDDLVSNRVIFKYTQISNVPKGVDCWIVLRDDETGELIDSRKVFYNTPEVFESKKKIASGKMTVTYFQGPDYKDNTPYIRVVSGVEVGGDWVTYAEQQPNDPGAPALDGTYSLTIMNAPELYSFALSDKYGITNTDPAEFDAGVVTVNAGFRTGLKQLVSIDPIFGDQKYLYVDDINDLDEITLDYNDFKEFDHYIPVTFESFNTTISMIGYSNQANYYNGSWLYDDFFYSYVNGLNKSNKKIGILDEFPVYRIRMLGGNALYSKVGAAPSSLDLPTQTFSIADNTVTPFKVVTTDNYTYAQAGYQHFPTGGGDPYFYLDYYYPDGDVKHFDILTDEIISKYSLVMTPLKLEQAKVIFGTQTYPEALDFMFGPHYDASKPYEMTTVFLPTN